MDIQTTADKPSVTVTLSGLTLEDVNAIVAVLDSDRNHPARLNLYQALKNARRLLGLKIEGSASEDGPGESLTRAGVSA